MLSRRSMTSNALILGALFCVSFVLLLAVWHKTENGMSEQAIRFASTAVSGFQEETVEKLIAAPESGEAPGYDAIHRSLRRIAGTNPGICEAYIYSIRDGRMRFLADAGPSASPSDGVDEKAAADFRKPFEQSVAALASSVDHRGSWISVLIPIVGSRTGNAIAVFGVKYSARAWYRNVIARTAHIGVLILLANLFILVLLASLRKNAILLQEKKKTRELSETVEKAGSRMAEAQALAHLGNWEFNCGTRQVWFSDEVFRIVGVDRKASSYTIDEVFEFLAGDDILPMLREQFDTIMRSRDRTELEYAFRRRSDGEVRMILLSAAAEQDGNGEMTRIAAKPTRVVGFIQDITERKRAEEKVRDTDQVFRTLYEQTPIGVFIGTRSGEMLDANPTFQSIVGRTAKELASMKWSDITHPDDIALNTQKIGEFFRGENEGYSLVKRYLRPDGSIVWVKMMITPLKLERSTALTHFCIVEDITERIRTEMELRERERSNAVLLSNLAGMAYRCVFDHGWTMRVVSEGCSELTGYRPESLVDNRDIAFSQIINPEYWEPVGKKWEEVLAERGVFTAEYMITTASGEEKWVYEQGRGVYAADGTVEAIEGLIIDITLRKKREDEVRYLLYHDVLTGLYNRSYFEEQKKRLDEEELLPLSVIIGDINGLKVVNETVGHTEGDKIIVGISRALAGCLREGDILARTGGDEFSVLLPNTGSEEANRILNRIELACEERRRGLDDVTYHAYLSLGCATKTKDIETLDSILKSAGENMYRDKLLQKYSTHSSVLASMKTTMYERSHETEEHAQRLVKLSRMIGLKLNLIDEQLNELELLSTLHDIGKIGVGDAILNKPDALSAEEWVEMKKHPEIGYRIAMSTSELVPIAYYILSHHERWDGLGYPQGLKAEEIPLLSRILSVVDAYDAMTEDRPYRKAMSKSDALTEIKKNSGTQFDPMIVEIFLAKIE